VAGLGLWDLSAAGYPLIVPGLLVSMNLHQGEHEIIKDLGMKYPLKIVVAVDKTVTTVITNYPLKKGKRLINPIYR
jgi:hypothetical protein